MTNSSAKTMVVLVENGLAEVWAPPNLELFLALFSELLCPDWPITPAPGSPLPHDVGPV